MPLGRRQCRGDRLALACGAHVDVSGHLDSSKELAGRGIETLANHLHDVRLRILSAMLAYPRSYQPASSVGAPSLQLIGSWQTLLPTDLGTGKTSSQTPGPEVCNSITQFP